MVQELECRLNQFDIATVIKHVMISPPTLPSWSNIKGRFIHPSVQYYLPSGKGKFYITERAAKPKNSVASYADLQGYLIFIESCLFFFLFLFDLDDLFSFHSSSTKHMHARQRDFLLTAVCNHYWRMKFQFIFSAGAFQSYVSNAPSYFLKKVLTAITKQEGLPLVEQFVT